MKIISTCEKEFIRNSVARNIRLDGRSLLEGRSLEIIFSEEWGCCLVALGNTRILAQVSAEVTEPKAVSPTEGALHINLEISAMSAPDVQYQSRMSDENVELQRILERCIRDSKCIDLESLCIVAGSKVWTIRVDVHALNNDGNLVECASLAAIAALAHFKRPDVTVVGTEVTVHSLEDREPVSLNLHHMPISINLALFADHIVTDPTDIEENVADGCYIICMNAHQEICLMHRIGVLLLSSVSVQKCEDVATKRSQALTQEIRKALDDDAYKRATDAAVGFVNMIQTGTILGSKQPIRRTLHEIIKQTQSYEKNVEDVIMIDASSNSLPSTPKLKTYAASPSQAGLRAKKILQDAQTTIFEGGASKWNDIDATIFEGSASKWKDIDENIDTTTDEEDDTPLQSVNGNKKTPLKKEMESSSEDEAVCISVDQLDVKPAASTTRTWYSKDPFG